MNHLKSLKLHTCLSFLFVSLLLLVQTGCMYRQKNPNHAVNLNDGTKICEVVSLPNFNDDETLADTTTSIDGRTIVYTYTKSPSSISIHTYLYSDDGTYQEFKQSWLKNIPFDSSCHPIVTLTYRRDGSADLLVREINKNHNNTTLYSTKDGNSRNVVSSRRSSLRSSSSSKDSIA